MTHRMRPFHRHLRTGPLALLAALALALGALIASTAPAQAATELPCDIYASHGTACVAAHSTVRALYEGYDGPLYQVERLSDSTTKDVYPLTTGGYANAATQNSFCASTTCFITEVFDQSGHGDNLTVEGAGGNGAADHAAIATALPVVAGGHAVYGLSVQAGIGYRDDATSGVPTGSTAQGAYMVTSGTHVDGLCCFDYGNAETNNDDNGNGHMESINFGTECWFSPCTGSGPWVQADLENGLFAGGNGSNTANHGNSSAFVTALLKSNDTTTYEIKGGNAQSGSLSTWYSGPARPRRIRADAPRGRDRARHRRRRQQRLGRLLLRGRDHLRRAERRGRQRGPGRHRLGRLHRRVPGVPGRRHRVPDHQRQQRHRCSTTLTARPPNGTSVDLWAALGNTCQNWAFTSLGSGRYRITNENTGTVLDSVDCGTTDGTAVDLWASLGNLCQEWNVTAYGGGYTISNVGNGMVLDAEDCETANGTVVRQWAQLDNTCQEWDITS
jgi:hypothetical protein